MKMNYLEFLNESKEFDSKAYQGLKDGIKGSSEKSSTPSIQLFADWKNFSVPQIQQKLSSLKINKVEINGDTLDKPSAVAVKRAIDILSSKKYNAKIRISGSTITFE